MTYYLLTVMTCVCYMAGAALCFGGLLWVLLSLLDWGIERFLRSFDIYREFFVFFRQRAAAKIRKTRGNS